MGIVEEARLTFFGLSIGVAETETRAMVATVASERNFMMIVKTSVG